MKRLIESLHLLATEATVQRTALPPFVAFADELALIFGDELRIIDLAAQPAPIRTALEELDTTLTRMSAQPALWTPEAVASDRAWVNVREQARDLLRSLGQEPRTPDLFWLSFVR